MKPEFAAPEQLLPRESYFQQDWFERERRELFDHAWTYACTEAEVAEVGDFFCLHFMDHPLFVLRGEDGKLRAFHNICRHRGCEVLEGKGNTGKAVMCPYHRWTYALEGGLRSVPNQEECFSDLQKTELTLHPAAVGTYRGMVYVNPDPDPQDAFGAWVANMDDFGWPHRFDDDSLTYVGEIVYEMQCNWKVFYENAIDGYHLGYLHDQTLGKLYPDRNVWRAAGRNVVWYSTEREGEPQADSLLSSEISDRFGVPRLPGHEQASYPGVVMLFPLTILSPNPRGFYVSLLEPVSAEVTNMRMRIWAPEGSAGSFDFSETNSPIRLKYLDEHPLQSGNFQLEDMWIVEKIQRTLRSPNYAVGPLANGAGAESPIMHFQESVLDYVPLPKT